MQGRSFRTIFFAADDRLRAGYRIALFFLLWGYGPAIVHSVLESTLLRFVAPEWFWLQGIALNLLRMAIIFAAGWAVAGDTPFTWTKQVAGSYGGCRNPLVVHWPKGIAAKGEVRSQWHHVIDVAPTVLDLLGIPQPAEMTGKSMIDGVKHDTD